MNPSTSTSKLDPITSEMELYHKLRQGDFGDLSYKSEYTRADPDFAKDYFRTDEESAADSEPEAGDKGLTSADTLVKYSRVRRVKDKERQLRSHYSHITGLTPLPKKDRGKSTKEILDMIFPPREFVKHGRLHRQHVSSRPAFHWDVKDLEQELRSRLVEQSADEGICPIRKQLYDQCFDEVVRQVVVNQSERGLLLARVRDELRMTLTAYHSLYASSTSYGYRKALMDAEENWKKEQKLASLQQRRDTVFAEVMGMELEVERVEREFREEQEAENQKHAKECSVQRTKNLLLWMKLKKRIKAGALLKPKQKGRKRRTSITKNKPPSQAAG